MRRILFIVSAAFAIVLSSCNGNPKMNRLQKENDSLRTAHEQLQTEVNSYFESMNDIAANLEKVKSIGGYLSEQASSETDSLNQIDQINNNIELVNKIIEDNNAKIAALNNEIKHSSMKLTGLEKTIKRLTSENAALSNKIEILTEEISKKNELISKQEISIKGLRDNVDSLENENNSNKTKLLDQKEQLYSAWYVFGTSDELKEQGIITKKGFFSGVKVLQGSFNKDYFVKIDLRKVSKIPLYSTHAKILTNHPSNSYVLEKENGQYILRILDTENFWSISKYLVIETN